MDKKQVKSNAKLRLNYFSVKFYVLAVVFRQQISKNQQFCLKLLVGFCQPNTTASMETFTVNN